MKDDQFQQFISAAHGLQQQAKRGELAETDNVRKKQVIENISAALSTAKARIGNLEAKIVALQKQCDEQIDRLREIPVEV